MKTRHVVLQDQSSTNIPLSQLQEVVQALQTQLDRDFTPIWGVHAQVQALDRGESVPTRAWPMRILDRSDAGLGVHLDKNGKPFAEIQAGSDWSITASHELLEMLVDPLGHKLIRDPDIDPASGGHQVEYLVEVGDPCEIFAYQINGVAVSDFVTPDYYDTNAPNSMEFDFLGRLLHFLVRLAGRTMAPETARRDFYHRTSKSQSGQEPARRAGLCLRRPRKPRAARLVEHPQQVSGNLGGEKNRR